MLRVEPEGLKHGVEPRASEEQSCPAALHP